MDNQEPKDNADKIVDMFANGEMGPETAARLLMLEFARTEMGYSEEELAMLESELEREQGK